MSGIIKILFVLALCHCLPLSGQGLPCKNVGSEQLKVFTGTWQVAAKDRTSPGNYEENEGISTISWSIEGCSIKEVYKGTYKQHAYEVQYDTYLTDSLQITRNFYDSEHGGLMSFSGSIEAESINVLWLRNPDKKRMQVKNELIWKDKDHFESITHLSTDYGQSWQLTHHWVYTRKR